MAKCDTDTSVPFSTHIIVALGHVDGGIKEKKKKTIPAVTSSHTTYLQREESTNTSDVHHRQIRVSKSFFFLFQSPYAFSEQCICTGFRVMLLFTSQISKELVKSQTQVALNKVVCLSVCPSGSHTAATHLSIFCLMLLTLKCSAISTPDIFTAFVKELGGVGGVIICTA